ncbi:MAG: DUF2849 domain-containing protein [Proteobacteria bacterium]|nr:DUF2849 domain-containing protein [Pseudomonadota bacterium]
MTGQIATANRLVDGAVVFRRADGGWGLRVEEAVVIADEAAAETLLAAAKRDAAAALVVEPYLVEVDAAGAPTSYRERIRAYGPSRAFHADVPTRHP